MAREDHSRRGVTAGCRGRRRAWEACGGHGVGLRLWGLGALGRVGTLSAALCLPAFPTARPPVKTFLDLGIVGTPVPTTPSVSTLNSLHHHGLCDGSHECQLHKAGPAPGMSSRPSAGPGREGTHTETLSKRRSRRDRAAGSRRSGESPAACLPGLSEDVAPGKGSGVLWRGRGFWEQTR